MARDPSQALKQAWDGLRDAVDAEAVKQLAVQGAVIFGIGMVLAVDPVAAQTGLDSLVSMMNSLADLLQRIGLAVAVVGLSAAGIAYMAHQPGTAKSIAQNVVIGTIILLLSGAAVEYISSGL